MSEKIAVFEQLSKQMPNPIDPKHHSSQQKHRHPDDSSHLPGDDAVSPPLLPVEAAQVRVRGLPEWRSNYFHLAMRRGWKIAKVAMARRLAV